MTMRVDYQPGIAGGWLALVSGDRTLVLRPGGADVDALFAMLRRSASVGDVLESLAGNGLSAIPPFAYLMGDGEGLRVIVRGSISVVTSGPSNQTWHGRDFSTWGEHVIADATGAEIVLDGAAPHGTLPLIDGAAWVAAVGLSMTDDGSPLEVPSASEPVVTPADPAADLTPVAEPTPPVDQDLEDHTVVVPRRASAVAAAPADGAADEATVSAVESVGANEPVLETVAAPPEGSGDHDGQTVLSDEVREAVATVRAEQASEPATATEPSPQKRYAIRMPDGTVEALDETVLIGRSPSVSKVSGGRIPRLLAIGGGDNDISRNHVQVEVQGDTVVVTDLQSRNGTVLVLPGTEPRKLRAGESATVVVGAVIDLGGGTTIVVEETAS